MKPGAVPVAFMLVALMLLANPARALSPELMELSELLTGSFTSAEQAASSEGYLEVEAEAVRIWPERSDGLWLYREQAILSDGGAKDRPYFQRIVHVFDAEGEIVREIYLLPEPAAFVGAYGEPARFDDLAPEDLSQRSGCRVTYARVAQNIWYGETGEGTCPSSHRGASTMIGRGIVSPEFVANWDRGFDAEGALVWGPAAGGYIFRRQ